MVGRMNTIRLVLVLLREREVNSSPRPGMSPSKGTFSIVRRSFSSISPPSAMIWPSSTVTVVVISRLLSTSSGDVVDTGPAIELTSWRMASLMVPPALICGFTSSWIPTFWRWMVRKALSKLLLSASPVEIGTSWPTRIFACWLSSVMIDGVDSTFEAVSAFTALMTKPNTALLPRSPPNPKVPPVAPSRVCTAASRKAVAVSEPLSSFSPATAPATVSRLGAALL